MRAAAYARYSTDHQCSIEIQFVEIQKYCASHGLELDARHMYSDEALSGMSKRKRRGFLDLLNAANAHQFDCVVFYDLSRGSRDVVDWFGFRKMMRQLGIAVYAVLDRLGSLDNPSDFLTELVTVGMGQTHVLISRQKSMDKVDYLASQGKFLGGYPPLGYIIVDGEYQIEPTEAEVVKRIYSMYASGHSYSEIMATIPPGMCGKRGRPLGKNSIHYILKNERYVGRYSWNLYQTKYMSEYAGKKPSDRAVIIDDAMPRIIDDVTWQKVRVRMQKNMHINNGKNEYLLKGLLRCGYCGAGFVGVTIKNGSGDLRKFYTCGNKRRTHTCNAKNIMAHDIEPLVVALLKHSVLDGSLVDATAASILALQNDEQSENISSTRAQLRSTNTKIDNLTRVLADGLDSDAVRQKLGELETYKRVLEIKIAEYRPEVTMTKEYLVAELSKDIEALKDDPGCLSELIRKYIVRIDVYDDKINIHSTADLCNGVSDGLAKLVQKNYTTGDHPDGVTMGGCGGGI